MIQLLSWAIMQDANEDLSSKNEGARVLDSKVKVKLTQSCLTLYDPKEFSRPEY